MSLQRAEMMATAWGSDLLNMGAAGHINIASGYGWWPAAHNLVSALALKAEATKRPVRRQTKSAAKRHVPVS